MNPNFKVYNGPVETFTANGETVELLPECRSGSCLEPICAWMSDRYCFSHALGYVKEWDEKNDTEWSYEI